MPGAGKLADHMRRLRLLLVLAVAYALVLQPLAMAGSLAAAPIQSGFLQLCAVGDAAAGQHGSAGDESPGHAGHGACCCLAGSGGLAPVLTSSVATTTRSEFVKSVIVGLSLSGHVQTNAHHPSARPRAPPVC